jgi:hypothetical protein
VLLSTSGWRPTAFWIVVQTNGVCCGPVNIGPVIGWLTSTRRSRGCPLPERWRTSSVLLPSTMPPITPSSRSPLEASTVLSRWPLSHSSSLSCRPGAARTSMRASPPDTWCGALDSTRSRTVALSAAGAAFRAVARSADKASTCPLPPPPQAASSAAQAANVAAVLLLDRMSSPVRPGCPVLFIIGCENEDGTASRTPGGPG